jgi:hypothetical protein
LNQRSFTVEFFVLGSENMSLFLKFLDGSGLLFDFTFHEGSVLFPYFLFFGEISVDFLKLFFGLLHFDFKVFPEGFEF